MVVSWSERLIFSGRHKLTDGGCRCPCVHIHPADLLCQLYATGNVVYQMFDSTITLPMCRPCADAYQVHLRGRPPQED